MYHKIERNDRTFPFIWTSSKLQLDPVAPPMATENPKSYFVLYPVGAAPLP